MMSSTKSLLSATSDSHEDIVRMCYLKKMKTMKKKFFVLRREGPKLPARLEYYDSEKKFKSGLNPKRSIELKKCFNINKRQDTRVKHCLALYTKDDCFCVVLDSAEDANDWLKSLLELQHGGATEPGEMPKPTFEFVWEVKVQEKGLGATYNILGSYRVCLTTKSLSLIKMGCKDEGEEQRHTYEFSLASIRRCGARQCFFYMEVGRSSVTGAGELWMVTDDQHIATHMHNAILYAMSGGSKTATSTAAGTTPPSGSVITTMAGASESPLDTDLEPKQRHRSSSNIETTKPLVIQRRQTHGNDTMLGFLSGVQAAVAAAASSSSVSGAMSCSSTTSVLTTTSLLSCSTAPSSASTEHPLGLGVSGSVGGALGGSVSSSRERCDSLPCAPRTRTTSEGYCPPSSAPHHPRVLSGLSHAHHLQGSAHNFLSPSARPHSMHYGSRGISYSPPIDCSPVSPVSGGCSTEDSAGSSLSIDETDGGSLPWSESALHHHQITRSLTESLGGSTPPSRYSGMLDNGRYGGGQLLSPDDSIPGSILEENSSDYIPWGSHISEEDQEYMQMDRQSASNLTLPLTTTASTTINNNKYPSNKSGSPSQSSYMEMSSPLGSSPRDVSGYIMMSPGADVTPQASTAPPFPRSSGLYISGAASANHSRGSSLAEDTPLGYVAMTPSSQASQAGSHKDDGYVDMAPDHSRGGSLGGSSCSLTSGTPSMTNTGDHSNHFSSEFHLEKVSSYFTPSEDEEDLGSGTSGSLPRHLLQESSQVRPARAYSLGSRPESMLRRHRLDVIQQQDMMGYQAARARALSMGAQQKPVTRSPLQQPRHHSPISIKGNSCIRTSAPSGPFLSSSWSGSSTASSAVAQKIPTGFQSTRDNPHASLEPISTDDNLMELDFSAAKKISSANSDYLEMDISSLEKAPTSPIFEEYVDMRKQSKPINLPKKSSNILPLFSSSRTEDRVSPNRGSPSQGSPNRGNTEDYLNMQCGNGRRSQPINIANTQPAASSSNKSSTSPNLFSLPGFFSRKNSSGTGTPPKVPERSNSPSPFSSLRRRGKKNSKKNKDKRNSMSSDDTSNVTTPVGMFPFSPSTPSKSFVPEEQFAKCSIDASSGGVSLTVAETTEDPYVSSQPTELAKRKVSTALRPPILGQSGGKTVVIGQDSLQAPTPTRARSSSSESEYVPMHPSRRKFSDAPGYSESSVLDKSRKCASDNILDSSKSDYALTLNERLSRKDAIDDYAMLAPGAGTSEMKPKVIQAGKPVEKPASDAYSVMQPTSLKSMQPSADFAMKPGIASTPPKLPEQAPSANDEYLMMSFSRTPPKSSMLDSRTVLETLTEHVATTNQDGDYAMLSPRTKIEKFSSTPPVTSRLSSTPPVTGRLSSTPPSKLTPPSSSKLSSTPPKLSSTPPTRESILLERKLSQPPNHLEDYALMIPGDGRSSPKLLENHHKLESTEVPVSPPVSSENSDYALMKPGENIIEYESSFKCVQPIEPDSGEYALLAQNQAALSLVSQLSEDYALMLPGKFNDDKATKEKENNTALLQPSETRKSPSPSRDSSDDYVLMTPAIKPSLLPTDAPISLHLNKPTSPHIPVVVMPTKATRTEDVATKSSSPLVSTNNVVPESNSSTLTSTTSTSIVPNSSTIVVPVTSITAIVPSSIAIIPSSTVTIKSNPIATKSSSIPLASSKPTQSTPIHIPKTKTTQSSCSKPITSTKISASSLPKPIPSKPIPVSTTRQVSKQQQQQQNKPVNNKNNLSSSAATKSSNNKQPMGQKSKCMNRRSASKSPLPPQPELNYASLDLPQCQETSTAVDDGSGAPALARNLSSDSSGESDVTSIGTTYAQIDFVRTQQQQQAQQQQQQQPQQQTSKKNNAKQERKS